LYFAAIALVLAYEMISGIRPNQTQTLVIYVSACIAIVILTAIYTTLGGIKAVIWTDLIQALNHDRQRSSRSHCSTLLFPEAGTKSCNGAAVFILTILSPPALIQQSTLAKNRQHLCDPVYHLRRPFRPPLSLWAPTALIRTLQRMLTAPDVSAAAAHLFFRLADVPIAFTFVSIGLLLWVYYQAHPDPTLPKTPNETFCHFILYEMPVGIRGLLIAGIFATAMGSLSTALNALATSFTRDWA
jgi:Na+/proline symporter